MDFLPDRNPGVAPSHGAPPPAPGARGAPGRDREVPLPSTREPRRAAAAGPKRPPDVVEAYYGQPALQHAPSFY